MQSNTTPETFELAQHTTFVRFTVRAESVQLRTYRGHELASTVSTTRQQARAQWARLVAQGFKSIDPDLGSEVRDLERERACC